MITLQKTENIVTDTETISVASLPAPIQNLVLMLDDWREQEANAASKLQLIRTAIDGARHQLLVAVQKHKEQLATPPAEVAKPE